VSGDLLSSVVIPDWPLIRGVHAAVTTRALPGASLAPFDRCNLGSRCGDAPDAVKANRKSLVTHLGLPAPPHWLKQVHGTRVIDDTSRMDDASCEAEADAAVTMQSNCVLAILTADCLPVMFAARNERSIGIAHAGWRGLASGVLEATVARMKIAPSELQAWIGPAIGRVSYEVGEEVRAAFVDANAAAAGEFSPTRVGHWLCDLSGLARRRLRAIGLEHVFGGDFDTFADQRFYSYRRSPQTGRFASLIWMDAPIR
jgi:YfiH family protein